MQLADMLGPSSGVAIAEVVVMCADHDPLFGRGSLTPNDGRNILGLQPIVHFKIAEQREFNSGVERDGLDLALISKLSPGQQVALLVRAVHQNSLGGVGRELED